MTDKERLEEIKEEVESLRGDMSVTSIETETSADIILDDMEWLIKQTERVQELEKEIEQEYSNHKDLEGSLLKENKRYREALEKIRKDQVRNGIAIGSISYRIACQALEGGKHERD